jgi:hypothetical protein
MGRPIRRDRGLRAPAAAAVALAATLAGVVGAPTGHAQPSESAPATTLSGASAGSGPITRPAVDLERAKDLYRAAEAEMRYRRFTEAVRDYSASYELSRDPALLFKIGRANEAAGRCEDAVGFYARYLREGQPTTHFVATARMRIRGCGGDPDTLLGNDTGADAGSAAAGSDEPAMVGAGRAAGSASTIPAMTAAHKTAWVLAGSALALVTLGGVLAYAASSSENDVRDLYMGFNGSLVTFDATTRQRYHELIDEGHRYQHLSWAAFGTAGAAAIGAALLFTLTDREAPIAPAITPRSAGVAVRF